MSLAASTAFEVANLIVGKPAYEIQILSEDGGMVVGSSSMAVQTRALSKARFDTLIVGAGSNLPQGSPALLSFLRAAPERVRRIASICTGAFILAQAGLLNGRSATTHWEVANEMRRRFPGVHVEEDRIFITDGLIWTSAGMSAGLDLALSMIEKDLGPDVPRAVARKLVLYHRRSGGQSQHSALLDLNPKSDRIQASLDYAKNNLAQELPIEQLAEAARLSIRQFSRAFKAETGQSPAKAVENLRVEAARLMLEQGRHSMDVVARETGFGDRQRMRRAFLRAFGHPPQMIRRDNRARPPLKTNGDATS